MVSSLCVCFDKKNVAKSIPRRMHIETVTEYSVVIRQIQGLQDILYKGLEIGSCPIKMVDVVVIKWISCLLIQLKLLFELS